MLMSWKTRACFSAHGLLPAGGLLSVAHRAGTYGMPIERKMSS